MQRTCSMRRPALTGSEAGRGPLDAEVAGALDPVAFARRCGIEPHAWQIEALRSTDPREAWICGRQTGKTTAAALLATHAITYGAPGSNVVLLSPGARQSGEVFMLAKHFYAALGRPAGAASERETSLTTEGGSRLISLPGGTGGATIRGLNCSLLIVDEGAQVDDEVFTASRPFVATTHGRILAMSTPWTQEGWFARAAMGKDPGWTLRKVPASDVLDPAFLESERSSMTPGDFAREYMNSFEWASRGLWTEAQWRALADPSVQTLAQLLAPKESRL
jgi:hypothetical protein